MIGAPWPHDDLQSLIAYYGKPWQSPSLLTHVPPPFVMRYEGATIHGILIHVRCAASLLQALNAIWNAAGNDQNKIDAWGISNYSGSYNYRNVRGASNLSCHAFGAAIDIDAEHNPRGIRGGKMPKQAVDAFSSVGATWGGTFAHIPDYMHFQFVREGAL